MEKENIKLEELKQRNYEMYRYFTKGLEIISILKSKMFEAYIVGGAARDFILNIDFKDIDIATDATPEQVKAIFPNADIDDTYAYLGAITIKEDNFKFEITTFRNEEYVKCRLKNVHYSKKLVEDIIRRDYTINALAITPNLNVVDLVGGQHDMEHKLVRVIGSGKRRFKDDPSRILRGLNLVAKFGYSLESNTAKAMRRSKVFLKELSDLKLMTNLNKLLTEKYGLKALREIDDNNLLKFLPNYACWVRLLIKSYRKLELIEKKTLLYRVLGNVVDNHGHSKNDITKMKHLLEISQHISVNEVDPMLVFTYGEDDLLSADRISKAYDRKYKKQKRLIKKYSKKLPIRDIRELQISNREILELVEGDNSKISYIMNELLVLVVNREISNLHNVLKDYAYRILHNEIDPKPEEILEEDVVKIVEEQQDKTLAEDNKKKRRNKFFSFRRNKNKDEHLFDDSDEEKKLYDKIYKSHKEEETVDFDAWDELPGDEAIDDETTVESKSKDTISDNRALIQLQAEYNEDFKQLFNIYIKGVKDYDTLSKDDKKEKEEQVKKQVKDFLVSTNSKYQILEERNII